jgi:hypothetical protein
VAWLDTSAGDDQVLLITRESLLTLWVPSLRLVGEDKTLNWPSQQAPHRRK